MAAAGLTKKRDHLGKDKGRGTRRQINEKSFHSLRYTATSLLKRAGISNAVAMDIIGHDSEAVSRIYTNIDSETKRQAIAKLPDVGA